MISEKIKTPWSSIGYAVYKRTYSRRLDESNPDSQTEEFHQTIARCLDACDTQLKVGYTKEERGLLEEAMLLLKVSFAGRFLWQLGTKTVDRLGLPSTQNCSFTKVNEPVDTFSWTMDFLMLGSGVGYNIQHHNVSQIPPVQEGFKTPTRLDSADADFIVPDTREGWVSLLSRTLKAAFLAKSPRKRSFTYSTQLIRSKGAPIKGFGGVASGPEDLVWGIEQIGKILESRRGQKITSVNALDIMNIIGAIVVSGNVRRSAEIAIGDYDDLDYLRSKRWDLGNIPNWRSMSNNSVACPDTNLLPSEFWEGYRGNGEPFGLINLPLARSCGRLGETQYPDLLIEGFNPLNTAAWAA